MKKTISLLFVLIITLGFAACATSGISMQTADPASTVTSDINAFNPETDVDNRYANAFCQIVELDNMFLWQVECPLCYYDKVTGFGDVFCSKPECDHNNPDCGGGILGKPAISYYDGKFYMLGHWPSNENNCWMVFRIDPVSTEREVFMTIPWYEDGSMTLMRMFIHRGKIFFVNQYQSVESGNPKEKYSLLTCDFEKHDAAELKPVFEFESKSMYSSNLFFEGSKIYLFANPSIDGHYKLIVWCYDTVSEETSTIADINIDDDYFQPNGFCVTQEGEIIIGQSAVVPDQNVKAYRIVDNELEVYMEFEEAETPWWGCYVNEETVTATRVVSENPRQDAVWVRDHKGNTIYKGMLSTNYRNGDHSSHLGSITYFGASRDRILLSAEFYTEAGGTTSSVDYYFIEYDITENGLQEKTLASWKWNSK